MRWHRQPLEVAHDPDARSAAASNAWYAEGDSCCTDCTSPVLGSITTSFGVADNGVGDDGAADARFANGPITTAPMPAELATRAVVATTRRFEALTPLRGLRFRFLIISLA